MRKITRMVAGATAIMLGGALLASPAVDAQAGTSGTDVVFTAAANAWPQSVVTVASTPDGQRIYLGYANGLVQSIGNSAGAYGDAANLPLNKPIVGVSPTASGRGYWLLASDGGVFSYGDAQFYGSTGSMRLNAPVVGMAPDGDGAGYWLVASDGGVFAFSAPFLGSIPGVLPAGVNLNKPIIGMVPSRSGLGYLLVASDGGVFAFGDAKFTGSLGANPPSAPVVGLTVTPSGNGYLLVDQQGRVYPFGDGVTYGNMTVPSGRRAVGIAHNPVGAGYVIALDDGTLQGFGPEPPRVATVTPGSYCSPVGATGVSETGKPMICSATNKDGVPYDRPRWRSQ